MAENISRLKTEEREEHNKTYGELAKAQLREYSIDDYEQEIAVPAWAHGGVVSGDINRQFLNRLHDLLRGYDRKTVRILDYGCGMGKLAVYLAQQGYANIWAFDISDEGVEFGCRHAELNGVADAIVFKRMDADALEYENQFFDVVIGKSVLHHTIKYPNTAGELHRVMKPGAVALFKENIGNNPLFKVARYITMDIFGHHGDVNITTKMLTDYAKDFSHVEVDAWNFMGMGKRLLWKYNKKSGLARSIMRILRCIDDATVHRSVKLRETLCGDAIFLFRR